MLIERTARKFYLMIATLFTVACFFAIVAPSPAWVIWYLGATVLMPAALMRNPAFKPVLVQVAKVHAFFSSFSLYRLWKILAHLVTGIAVLPTASFKKPPDDIRPRSRFILASSLLLRAPPFVR
jgi:hypothetical protein